MRRFVIGIIVLSVLLGSGIAVSLLFRHGHQPAAALLEEAASAALSGEHALARERFQQARHRWEQYHHFTAAFSDHAPMEEIDGLFARLEIYARLEEWDHFVALCAQLSELTKAMAYSHTLHWWTLL